MKNRIALLPQLYKRGFFFILIMCGLITSATVKAQLPTARKIAGNMGIGWNLGNTLEAIGGEDAWGAGHTSQQLIDSVKAAGFNTVRIPVAWFCHSDTTTSVLDKEWIARVKEVVDYCMNRVGENKSSFLLLLFSTSHTTVRAVRHTAVPYLR